MHKIEPGNNEHCRMTRTGYVKMVGLSNKKAKQSDPRLDWIMFHNICKMYRDVTHDTKNYYDDLLIKNGTTHSIETELLGQQDSMEKDFEGARGS